MSLLMTKRGTLLRAMRTRLFGWWRTGRDGTIVEEYDEKDESTRSCHHLTPDEHLIFIEIEPGDASDFSGDIEVKGPHVGRHHILRTKSPAIPNALAAILDDVK